MLSAEAGESGRVAEWQSDAVDGDGEGTSVWRPMPRCGVLSAWAFVMAAAARRRLDDLDMVRLLGSGRLRSAHVPYLWRNGTKREELFVRYEGVKRCKSLWHKGENYFQPSKKSLC